VQFVVQFHGTSEFIRSKKKCVQCIILFLLSLHLIFNKRYLHIFDVIEGSQELGKKLYVTGSHLSVRERFIENEAMFFKKKQRQCMGKFSWSF